MTFGGQFENQQRAAKRLALVVPIAIVLIFFMLFTTFRSLMQAGVIILNIPFAMIGGVVSLYLFRFVPVGAGVGRFHHPVRCRGTQRCGHGELL